MRINNLKGRIFNRLIVLQDSKKRYRGNVIWICLCSCGKLTEAKGGDLLTRRKKSCGCLRKENTKQIKFKHGDTRTRLYRIWRDMKQRCLNPSATGFKHYGGRGIEICDEWLKYLPFKNWALANGYANNLTIDRIHNNEDYTPKNCQFISKSKNTQKAFLGKKRAKQRGSIIRK